MAVLTWMVLGLVCLGSVSCSGCDGAVEKEGRRVYTLAASTQFHKRSYLSDEGYHEGFFKDIVSAVCAEADMDCRLITAPFQLCWQSKAGQHQRGGVGLMDGWLDACVGYFQTTNRAQVFRLSQPFLNTPDDAYFYVKIDSTRTLDDLFDDKKIGFVNGWFSDEQCVARVLGKVIAEKNLFHSPAVDTLTRAFINDEVDAIFIIEMAFGDHFDPKVMKKLGPAVHCTLGSNSIIARKDNDIVDRWNEGFSKLVSSGRYRKLCDESNKRHTKYDVDLYCL